LIASGFIVGESLVGVAMAAVIGATGSESPLAVVGGGFAPTAQWISLAVFCAVALWFGRRVRSR
jgi:membrane protein implicated in regulation of membrane protease activity